MISAKLRDNNFDALRLLFASMVVFFHVGILSQHPALKWCMNISASFAVQAFFVVSGFLVTMSFENTSSVNAYALKRFKRITPAYVVVVLGAAISLAGVSDLSWADYFQNHMTFRYVAFNLMLSNFNAPTLPGVFQTNYMDVVNGSLWTIKIEVAFYLLVPFIVWAVRRSGTRLVLGAIFACSIAWRLGFAELAAATHTDIYNKLAKQLPGQLCFFVGGAWAYYRTRENKDLSGAWAVAGLLGYYAFDDWVYELIAPFAVTAVVYWAAITAPRLPRFAKYGDFSYGIYLYHFPVIQAFIAIGVYKWSASIGLFFTLAAVCVAAVLSWHLVEHPALSLHSPRA